MPVSGGVATRPVGVVAHVDAFSALRPSARVGRGDARRDRGLEATRQGHRLGDPGAVRPIVPVPEEHPVQVDVLGEHLQYSLVPRRQAITVVARQHQAVAQRHQAVVQQQVAVDHVEPVDGHRHLPTLPLAGLHALVDLDVFGPQAASRVEGGGVRPGSGLPPSIEKVMEVDEDVRVEGEQLGTRNLMRDRRRRRGNLRLRRWRGVSRYAGFAKERAATEQRRSKDGNHSAVFLHSHHSGSYVGSSRLRGNGPRDTQCSA